MPSPHTTYTCQGTHIGHTRRVNEDALFVNEAEGLWLVADGIGGHGNGDKASAAVVEHVESYCQRNSVDESLADITSRLRQAHQRAEIWQVRGCLAPQLPLSLFFSPRPS